MQCAETACHRAAARRRCAHRLRRATARWWPAMIAGMDLIMRVPRHHVQHRRRSRARCGVTGADMREHIQLAERIVASATAGGINGDDVAGGRIQYRCPVSRRQAAGRSPCASGDFPARLLRGQLYDDLARAGWSGDAHIVDICGPARSTTGSAGTGGGFSPRPGSQPGAQRGRTASRLPRRRLHFNPRPARRPDATRSSSSCFRGNTRFNPRPAPRPDATVNHGAYIR